MKICRVIIILIVLLICTGCSNKKPYSKSGFYFDTVVTITLYDSSKDELIDECFQICQEFENKISKTNKNSEISQINAAKGTPVKVSTETIEILKKGIYYSELSDGAFDITIGSLTDLWKFEKDINCVPSNIQIQSALPHVDYKNIQIRDNYVSLNDTYSSIDLGGIAKGYIADYLKQYLVTHGVKHAIINLGGNVLTIGSKPDGSPFQIGIQRPFSETSENIISVNISDGSVVTSGVYERYFKHDNTLYHHIIDTSTGFPCDTDLLSVTILSESSVDGDALGTICLILGRENALTLLEKLEHIDAILITNTYEIIDTRQ